MLPVFAAEVGGHFPPLLGFPFKNRCGDGVCTEPVFSSGDDLIELFGLRCALQCRLAFSLLHPENGIVAVGIDGLVLDALLVHQGEGMDNGEKLSDVVGAVHRTEVEYLRTGLQVDALIFHRAGIAGAGGVYRPCVGDYLVG